MTVAINHDLAGTSALVLPVQTGQGGKYLKTDGASPSWDTPAGDGTVTSVSVNTANGISGSVTNATTTPAISITLNNPTLNSVVFDTTPSVPSYAAGNVFWDAGAETLAVQTGLGATTLQVGQEGYVKCRNSTGSGLLNGQIVYISGATSGLPTIALAKADAPLTSESTLGVLTHNVANGADGFVTVFGLVHDIDTSAFAPGTTLFLSATTAGAFTDTQPSSPDYVVHMGHVITQNAVTGSFYVNVDSVTQMANSVRIEAGTGITEMNNLQDVFRHSWSSGITDGCAITNNGNGSVSIASGEIVIRETSADDAVLTPLVVPAQAGITMTSNDVSYLYVDYNAGSPQWVVGSSLSDFDGITKVIGYVVGRNGTTLNIVDLRRINVDFGRKNRRQKAEFDGYAYRGWWRSVLGQSTLSGSGLSVLVGSGKYFYFDNPITHAAFDTTVVGTATPNVFKYFYNRTGTWSQIADSKTIDNTQYDNAGVLTTMTNGRVRTDWVYVVMCGTVPYLAVIMGNTQHNTLAQAQAESVPSTLPPQFDGIGILVGQIAVEKNAATFTAQLAGGATFVSGGTAVDHNSTSNIQGGTSNEYYHHTASEHTVLSALLAAVPSASVATPSTHKVPVTLNGTTYYLLLSNV